MGHFARVHVEMDIMNSLPSFMHVGSTLGVEDSVNILAYEKLPDFCYACGRTGHSHRKCDNVMVDKKN